MVFWLIDSFLSSGFGYIVLLVSSVNIYFFNCVFRCNLIILCDKLILLISSVLGEADNYKTDTYLNKQTL